MEGSLEFMADLEMLMMGTELDAGLEVSLERGSISVSEGLLVGRVLEAALSMFFHSSHLFDILPPHVVSLHAPIPSAGPLHSHPHLSFITVGTRLPHRASSLRSPAASESLSAP